MTKKSQNANVVASSEAIVEVKPENDLEAIMALVKSLQEELQTLKSGGQEIPVQEKTEEVDEVVDQSDPFDDVQVPNEAYIKVMSLSPYQLNLSTGGMGRGKIFTFREFGQVKRILYSDLVQILETHESFLRDGLFYIMDRRVIRKNGLDDIYKSILNADNIEKILSGKHQDAFSMFKSANKRQRQTVIEMLIVKLRDDPESLDLNLIDKISRESGVNILERAREAREEASK